MQFLAMTWWVWQDDLKLSRQWISSHPPLTRTQPSVQSREFAAATSAHKQMSTSRENSSIYKCSKKKKKIARNHYWSYHLPGAFVCLWLRIYSLNIRRKLGSICPGSHVQSVASSCLVTHSWRKVVRWLSGSRVDLYIFGLRRSRLGLDHTRWAGASAKAAVCFAKKITVLCPSLGWCLNHLCWFKY